MQSDRYIKVGCISRYNRTTIPDFVSLETSMEFGNKDYDGSGSLLIDNGGDVPKLDVFILDPFEDIPIKEARIGQLLKLVISMESHYENYDLRAINLTATSDYDRLELIGPTGCPKNAAIFPALQHVTTRTSRQLVTKFKAFKFASSSQLRISVAIQFCHKACNPINCGNGVISHGRKKRQAESAGIVNKDVLGPVIFPDQTTPAPPLGKIIFPDETTTPTPQTTTQMPLGPVKFPGPVNEKLVTRGPNGVRVDSFGNPQGIQQYFGGIKDQDNEVLDDDDSEIKSRSDRKVVTVPLDVTLNVIEPDVGTDRLVIGDNDQIYVAGLGGVILLRNALMMLKLNI